MMGDGTEHDGTLGETADETFEVTPAEIEEGGPQPPPSVEVVDLDEPSMEDYGDPDYPTVDEFGAPPVKVVKIHEGVRDTQNR